jgi:Na+/proline symporter
MPLLERPLVMATAVLYLVAVQLVGLWAARRTHTAREFFIAGQRAGVLVTGFAAMASAFSGFVFLGGPGLSYHLGLSSLWIVLPAGYTAHLLAWVVGRRLRLLAAVREIYTVPDAVACRFDSPVATGLAALAIAFGSVAYLGAQLLALAVLLQSIFALDSLGVALLLGLLVLLGYSVAGGMMAGVYTEVLQGAVMLLAAIAIFWQALHSAGGWRTMVGSIAASPAFGQSFLEPLGGVTAAAAFGLFFVFGVGVLGQPHVLHKFYMLDDPRKLRFLPLVLGWSQVLCLTIWLGVGLAVPALVAQGKMSALARPDEAAPQFLLQHAPQALAGLTFAGVLAAIMSTANALMNIGAAALVRDLPRALGRPLARELGWARAAVLLITAAAASLALVHGEMIALLGTFAFGTFAAALAPTLAVGLNWSRVGKSAAIASMATGLVLNLALEASSRSAGLALPPGVPPAALSLAASFAVLFAVTWMRRAAADAPLPEDVRRALEIP